MYRTSRQYDCIAAAAAAGVYEYISICSYVDVCCKCEKLASTPLRTSRHWVTTTKDPSEEITATGVRRATRVRSQQRCVLLTEKLFWHRDEMTEL